MPERELSFVEDQLKKAFCTPALMSETNRFFHGFLVSDSVEITSIRVYILKQLFTSGSVNIVNFAFGE